MMASFPLHVASPVQTPALTTLWITDGRQGRCETPRARGHVFQLSAEEAMVALDVVISMYSFIIMSS